MKTPEEITRTDRLTPEMITQLHDHEAELDTSAGSEDVSMSKDAFNALQARLTELESQAKAAQSKAAATEAEKARFMAELTQLRIKSDCLPTTIGGYNGVHPHEMDLVMGTSPHQLLTNVYAQFGKEKSPFKRPIVLIPVEIWPDAVQPDNRPTLSLVDKNNAWGNGADEPCPNYQVGTTRIQETYLSVPIRVAGINRTVSLQGMAVLNIHPFSPFSPDDVRDRLDRRESRTTFSKHGGVASDSALEDGTGTFIPSHATIPTTAQESRPDKTNSPLDAET